MKNLIVPNCPLWHLFFYRKVTCTQTIQTSSGKNSSSRIEKASENLGDSRSIYDITGHIKSGNGLSCNGKFRNGSKIVFTLFFLYNSVQTARHQRTVINGFHIVRNFCIFISRINQICHHPFVIKIQRHGTTLGSFTNFIPKHCICVGCKKKFIPGIPYGTHNFRQMLFFFFCHPLTGDADSGNRSTSVTLSDGRQDFLHVMGKQLIHAFLFSAGFHRFISQITIKPGNARLLLLHAVIQGFFCYQKFSCFVSNYHGWNDISSHVIRKLVHIGTGTFFIPYSYLHICFTEINAKH